jgi:Sulfotransferase domain
MTRAGISNGKILPNFFIIGAAKCGTTSFAEYLEQHPQVYMSPVKEPHYFASDIESGVIREDVEPDEYFSVRPLGKRHALCVRRQEHYEQLFVAAADSKAIGEASPSYLYSTHAPRRIHEEIADPRFLVFLRNPIERAYSHFQMDLIFEVAESDDFLQAVEMDARAPRKGWGVSHLYVELGLYSDQLKRYLEYFPADHLKVCIHDDYRQDVRATLLDILSFLGVERTLSSIDVDTRHGEAWRKPMFSAMNRLREKRTYRALQRVVPQSLRSKAKMLLSRKQRRMCRPEFEALLPLFRESILELSSLLRRDLSHWLVPPPYMLRS